MTAFLEAALAYAAVHLPVFPLVAGGTGVSGVDSETTLRLRRPGATRRDRIANAMSAYGP